MIGELTNSSLAIDAVRSRGGAPDRRVPQEPGASPLLVVVQRIVQVLRPVLRC